MTLRTYETTPQHGDFSLHKSLFCQQRHSEKTKILFLRHATIPIYVKKRRTVLLSLLGQRGRSTNYNTRSVSVQRFQSVSGLGAVRLFEHGEECGACPLDVERVRWTTWNVSAWLTQRDATSHVRRAPSARSPPPSSPASGRSGSSPEGTEGRGMRGNEGYAHRHTRTHARSGSSPEGTEGRGMRGNERYAHRHARSASSPEGTEGRGMRGNEGYAHRHTRTHALVVVLRGQRGGG